MPTNPDTVDYRVSRLIVLCKDCGEDVGLYPARHKCDAPERPPLPTLEIKNDQGGYATFWDMFKSTVWTSGAAATADNDTSTPGGALWTRVMDATTTVAKAVGVVVDDESDSDVDENGETKVTRELKAYYTKQGRPLPEFLLKKNERSPSTPSFDERDPRSRSYASEADGDYRGQSRERTSDNSADREGSRYPLRHRSQDASSGKQRMQGFNNKQRVPIPIRARPLRDEEDPQEMARRREAKQASAGGPDSPRTNNDGQRNQSRPQDEERRYVEREAAFAALDGKVKPPGKSKRDYGEGRNRPPGEERRPSVRMASSPTPRPRLQERQQASPPRSRDAFGDSQRYEAQETNNPRGPSKGSSYPINAPRMPPTSTSPRRGAPSPRRQVYAESPYGMQAPPPRAVQGRPPVPKSRPDYDPRYARQPNRPPPPDAGILRAPPPRRAIGGGGSPRTPKQMGPKIDQRMASKMDQRLYARMEPRFADPMANPSMHPRAMLQMDRRGDSRRSPRTDGRVDPRMADPRMGRY